MIPEEVVRSVREVADIRHVVGEYVSLRQAGRNWIGLCPFHPDKDPSFSVNDERQAFYCFGCGEGGDVFKFLIKIQGLSFLEAVKALASRYGIVIPERPLSEDEARRQEERKSLVEMNEAAASFFHRTLLQAPEAGRAREYLADRGLSEEIILRFRLGWAPDHWDGLIRHFNDLGLSLEAGEKAGLLVPRPRGTGLYDRFRGRVIFPIVDLSGRVIALGGRLLGEGHPKYLNSPETPVYQKGRILYGLYQGREDIRRAHQGFVVEGYMDLLALVQAGINTAVATLGTALTAEHVQLLRKYSKDWVLVFDGDAAGTKAALRTLPLFFEAGLQTRVLSLPEKDDPDSFVRREGVMAWKESALAARAGIDFAVDQGLGSHGRGPEGKARTVEMVLPLLKAIKDPVRQSLMVGHLAQRLGIREEILWQRMGDTRPPAVVSRSSADLQHQRAGDREGTNLQHIAEGQLIGFLLSYPQHIETFFDLGLDFWLEDPRLRDIWLSMVHLQNSAGGVELSALLTRLEGMPALKALASRLAMEVPPCEQQDTMLEGLLRYCEKRRRKALRRQLLEQIGRDETSDDEACLRRLLQLR